MAAPRVADVETDVAALIDRLDELSVSDLLVARDAVAEALKRSRLGMTDVAAVCAVVPPAADEE